MASTDLKPVYLLAGSDRPKITRALERLRGRFDPDGLEHLSAIETAGADAVAACNAMGLFAGGGRLVIVDDVDRWKAPDVKAVAEYVVNPAPETVLALVGEEVKKDSALAKACAKAGDLLIYDVAKKDVPKWVADQFALREAKADRDACRALIVLVGENLDELATEVDKLATWAGGEPITEDDVAKLVPARAEVPPFELTDAWGRRDVRAALGAAQRLAETSSIPGLVGRLAAHVRRVRTCQTLDAEGVRPRDAAGRLKMHPFVAEKAFAQARNFSAEELNDAVVRLAALDHATKGGTRLPDDFELERTVVEITRRR